MMKNSKAIKCPKCGSTIQANQVGEALKGFCRTCGRYVWACPICGYATFSQRGLAGHMKRHKKKADLRSIIEELNASSRLSSDYQLDFRSIIEELEALRYLSEELEVDFRTIIEVYVLLKVNELLERVKAVENSIQALHAGKLAGNTSSGKTRPKEAEIEDKALPSFARGNPWIAVIGKRGRRNEY